MHTINIIEIDFEGKVHPSKQVTLDFLPRKNERIILNNFEDNPNAYKVLDIHHIPEEGTTVYVTHERTLQNAIQSLANETKG
ncbi:hypothetical protein [Ekhidna sp.]|uniref:hypothetical protein n=1 Tax=Ekhidna sp. TaxID=2608089 RepID=UPI0032EB8757